ncbi:MAG: Na+/H+ antiporter subunit E [Gammaproteobacteria bacterium]|nr:Na+/H+ antiporter subunit E [Gammaproteobacteria bacterium]
MNTVKVFFQKGWLRALLFSLLWWVLTNGAMNSWLVGVPVVFFATLVSVTLLPPSAWSFNGIVRFIPFFLWRSLYGGVDVAMRALHPRLPISPGMYDHQWQLPPGMSRFFMANTVSLLPGTLSTELDDDYLRVHILDHTGNFASELKVIEAHVANIFGLALASEKNG